MEGVWLRGLDDFTVWWPPWAQKTWGVNRILKASIGNGIRLIFLPPYSPELGPVERVWPLVNEAVANRYFRDLEEMAEVVAERCRVLDTTPCGLAPAWGLR